MNRTIPVQNGITIKIPKHVKKLQVQAIRKGDAVMVTWKGMI